MGTRNLTNEEYYTLIRTKGFRRNRIKEYRRVLLEQMARNSEKEGVKPSNALKQKIKRETDITTLIKHIFAVAGQSISIAELEADYDKLFRTTEELQNRVYSAYWDLY